METLSALPQAPDNDEDYPPYANHNGESTAHHEQHHAEESNGVNMSEFEGNKAPSSQQSDKPSSQKRKVRSEIPNL